MELTTFADLYVSNHEHIDGLKGEQGTICDYELEQGEYEELLKFVRLAHELVADYK